MLHLARSLVLTSIPATAALAQAHSDSAAVAAAVEGYHQALSKGDSAAALALLSPAAVIVESGRIESLGEYRSHHLPADIAFARAVKSIRTPVLVSIRGDVAWTVARSTTRGTYRGKPMNSAGAELMVLTRSADKWAIRAIHWSSQSGLHPRTISVPRAEGRNRQWTE
jgi:ketosteroid isomerase-like protein